MAPILEAGDLVTHGDVFFGQGLEPTVIVHVLLDLRRLILGDAFREFFAAKEALEDVIGATTNGVAAAGFEELPAQGTAAEAVNGLHLLEEGLSFLEEDVEVWFHKYCIYTDTIARNRWAVQLAFRGRVT